MSSRQIEIYDTTLRDGTQGLGVTLSLSDKLELTKKLDWFGVHYVEGGWPGSNPKDQAYFEEARKLTLRRAKLVSFGSTRRAAKAAENDENLQALVASGTDVTCIFGKAWDLHVTDALRVTLEENLQMIRDSVAFLRQATGKPVFFDAEHFFDGFAANPEFALAAVAAAYEAGAARIVLCDTNGGSLPQDIKDGVQTVQRKLGDAQLGIHVHNDGGLAVANTLAGLQAGAMQAQGTINGIGERCGNVDLTAVIANCELKLGFQCLPEGNLSRAVELSREVWERSNMSAPLNQPYVGEAAFAHKGGIHVSAMQRNSRTYEHVSPDSVGNHRRILISDMSGRSNLLAKLANRYPQLTDEGVLGPILNDLQDREHFGYSYEAADGSFDLLVRRHIGQWRPAFELDYYRVHGIGTGAGEAGMVEATVKLTVKGTQRLCAAEGNGPVDALSHALTQALAGFFPELESLSLVDYKVRVVDSADGTGARVRVLTEHKIDGARFGTVGVHANIIEASWHALVEAIEYSVLRAGGSSTPESSA